MTHNLLIVIGYLVIYYLAGKAPAWRRHRRIKKLIASHCKRPELSEMNVYVGHNTGNILLFDPEHTLCMCLKNALIDQ